MDQTDPNPTVDLTEQWTEPNYELNPTVDQTMDRLWTAELWNVPNGGPDHGLD